MTHTLSICLASCGGPPLMANVYFSGSTVRHSDTSSLWDASTSQFLTRFSTNISREPALWLERLSVGAGISMVEGYA